MQAAVTKSGLWEELASDWVCLDCELMPWSSKAQDLLRQQYAPTGAAARTGLAASIAALRTTSKHLPEASELTGRYQERPVMAEQLRRGVPPLLLDCSLIGRFESLRRSTCWRTKV